MATLSLEQYLSSKRSIQDKINALDTLINAMILRTTQGVNEEGVTIDQYMMDNGQTKIQTSYRSVDSILKGINALDLIKTRYENQLSGRCVVLRDVRGLT